MARAKLRLTAGEIIDRLTYPRQGRLPREALREAIARPSEIEPFLLAEISRTHEQIATRSADAPEGTSYWMLEFAIMLLAANRATAAFPSLIQLFSAKEQQLEIIASDFVTEDLHQVFARCYDGHLHLLTGLIENEGADDYVRHAAICALRLLSDQGVIERRSAVGFLARLLARLLERLEQPETGFFGSVLVSAALDFREPALRPLIGAWFDAGLVDETYLARADVEREYSKPGEEVRAGPDAFGDLIAYFEGFACFKKPSLRRPRRSRPLLPRTGELAHLAQADLALNGDMGRLAWLYNTTTEVRAAPKVGRNDPCPCGSGKKHKKCCLYQQHQ